MMGLFLPPQKEPHASSCYDCSKRDAQADADAEANLRAGIIIVVGRGA